MLNMYIALFSGWINPIEISLVLLGVVYMVIYSFNVLPRFNAFATPFRAVYIFIGSLFAIAMIKTFLQYQTWAQDGFTKLLLPPYQSWGYFSLYAAGHFWFGMLLGVTSSMGFYFVLRTYVRMRLVSIPSEHLLIACMGALVVGWPRFVFFVPLALVLAIFMTILNMLIFKKNEVPFLPAFVIGSLLSLLYGTKVLSAIGLSVLTV